MKEQVLRPGGLAALLIVSMLGAGASPPAVIRAARRLWMPWRSGWSRPLPPG